MLYTIIRFRLKFFIIDGVGFLTPKYQCLPDIGNNELFSNHFINYKNISNLTIYILINGGFKISFHIIRFTHIHRSSAELEK